VARIADAFDIIHFHTDFLHFLAFAQRGRKTLTTMPAAGQTGMAQFTIA